MKMEVTNQVMHKNTPMVMYECLSCGHTVQLYYPGGYLVTKIPEVECTVCKHKIIEGECEEVKESLLIEGKVNDN